MSVQTSSDESITYNILANPDFNIEPPTDKDYIIASLATFRSTVYLIGEKMTEGAMSKAYIKVIGGVADMPFSAINICLSHDEEGWLKAIVTGVAADGVSILGGMKIGGAIGGIPGSIIGALAASALSLILNPLADSAYDFYEDKIKDLKYNEATKTLTYNTTIPDINNIKELIAPMYACSIEEGSEYLKSIVVNQDVNGQENIYKVVAGDTIYDISKKYGINQEDLVDINPWLADRFSDDGQFALVRPNEKLLVPGCSNGIPAEVNDTFTEADSTRPFIYDPLLLDLDGDGIETTTAANGVFFDHESDGFAETSAWVSKDDGILVFDKNGNGRVDTGNEIFGNNYVKSDGTIALSGFDALSDLDSNGDGIISSLDEKFNDLRVLKGDGTWMTLDEAGIASINLTANKTKYVDENGNTRTSLGSYTKTDGTTAQIGDYLLQSDKVNSIAAEWLEVSDEIAKLPDISGAGTIYSLHQAMVRNDELKQLVQRFSGEPDLSVRRELLTQIIYKWAGVEDIDSASRGKFVNAKELHVLEKFMARDFVGYDSSGNPNNVACGLINNAYAILRDYIFAELASQTHLKPLYDMLELQFDDASQKYIYKLETVQNYIDNAIGADVMSGKMLLLDFAQSFVSLGLKENSNYAVFEKHFSDLGIEFNLIMQTVEKINIYGTNSDDKIDSSQDSEAVFGYDGNDKINTRQGDDIVYGGDGDDIIDTCMGNDIIYGEDGSDTIQSGNGNDIVYGGEGNDIIKNQEGDDYIDSGAGDDYIETHYGNETLMGGTGNDTFEDTFGGDETFIFNKGDGSDVIKNVNGNDRIVFGEGITKADVKFHGEGGDLHITFKNTTDSIVVKQFLSTISYRVETLQFADGSMLTADEILGRLVTEGTDGADRLRGTSIPETIYGYGGDDVIESVGNDNKVYGGDGNDTIRSGGNDYIDGGAGDDYIETHYGNETLMGGIGNDTFEDTFGGDDIFIFNKGDGSDVIKNVNGNDKILFGEGITKADVKFHGEGGDLHITFKNTTDSIVVKQFLSTVSYRVETLQFADGSTLNANEIMQMLIMEGDENDNVIRGTSYSENIYGYGGNDTIESNAGDDKIYGGDGNDIIKTGSGRNFVDGGNGDDYIETNHGNGTIVGGEGNDTLNDTFGGDDTFIFNKGDGNDTIKNVNGDDRIVFGEGITKDDVKFHGEGGDLHIAFKDTTDYIVVKQYLSTVSYRIETLEFSDGSILTADEILRNLVTEGTDGADRLEGTSIPETIYGYGGDDVIESVGNDNIVYGGDGNDTIRSGGDDYIDGGNGNDTIIGKGIHNQTYIGGRGNDYFEDLGGGDDTFIFNQGDGSDVIKNYDGDDRIVFGEGITKDDVKFHGEGGDLHIAFKDTTDYIVVKQYLSTVSYRIESLQFADGSMLTADEILGRLVTEGTDGADRLEGTSIPETIYGYGGDDVIESVGNDNIVYGGDGNDTIRSGGNDYIDGGTGNDTIIGKGIHNQTYIGGKGNDYFEDLGGGDDTFIFNSGDGNDVIKNYDGNDTIVFNESVNKNDIAFFLNKKSGSVFIDYGSDAGKDTIEIISQQHSNYTIETLELKDSFGTTYTLTNEDINKLIQDMSAYAADNGITISSVEDVKQNSELMYLVNSAWAA